MASGSLGILHHPSVTSCVAWVELATGARNPGTLDDGYSEEQMTIFGRTSMDML